MKRVAVSTITVVGLLVTVVAAAAGNFSYDDYASVLATHVDERGLVDYGELKKDHGRLDAFVESLAALDGSAYEAWTETEKIAFWINAYNGLTLKLIVDHYPIEGSWLKSLVFPKNSIRQIPGAWTDVEFDVMGETITLDSIEHDVLRRRFDDPRIHMALVCAALSCPELRNEPYFADRLDDQLDDQAREFMGQEDNFRVDGKRGVVWLSAIFDWFAGDFAGRYGTGDPEGSRSESTQAVINFVSRYVPEDVREYLATGDYRVKYMDYDWTLNEQPDSSLSSN